MVITVTVVFTCRASILNVAYKIQYYKCDELMPFLPLTCSGGSGGSGEGAALVEMMKWLNWNIHRLNVPIWHHKYYHTCNCHHNKL